MFHGTRALIWLLPLFNWDALPAKLVNVTLEIPGRDLQPTKCRLKLSFQTSVSTLQNRPPWIPPTMTCAENRHPRLDRDRQITLLRVIPALTHDSDIVSDIYYSIILRYHLEVYTAYLS